MADAASTIPGASAEVVADRAVAHGYLAKVCFKTGPPRRLGVELEWTVHHLDDATRPLTAATLVDALGDYAPSTLRPESRQSSLPRGGVVTVEPGGQVEISTPPFESLTELHDATTADIDFLGSLLARAGLRLGDEGCDPHRPASRILHSARYLAMERAFDRVGSAGRTMMASTAGLQVCLDVGLPDRAAARWRALHLLGPVLLAVFANSPRLAGAHTGWASSRMRSWYSTDPIRTKPTRTAPTNTTPISTGPISTGSINTVPSDGQPDPASSWARQVLDTPLLCVRRDEGEWDAPPGVTFADWIAGAFTPAPTYADLDYHLGTLFPPVRARGYFEVRYLDAQPNTPADLGLVGWFAPVAVLAALFAREDTVDDVAEIAFPAADRWVPAARDGLRDPVIARIAPQVLDLACRSLHHTGLPAPIAETVTKTLQHRLHPTCAPAPTQHKGLIT